MFVIGIVGSEESKFTDETKAKALDIIRNEVKLSDKVCSGHCHLGGIDIWAEDIADELGKDKIIYPPKHLRWEPQGYRDRNIRIAKASDRVICITIKSYPESYTGMKFKYCYHCKTYDHIKSGGCWTIKCAERFGKPTQLYIIE